MFKTLIQTHELAIRLDDPDLVVIDCRFDLKDTDAGERAYQHAHIPGAVYGHLDRDFAGAKTGTNGRHPLPAPDALAHTFGRFGVRQNSQVVAYDDHAGMYASRCWWLLRWLGHETVAVLDGGFSKWIAEGRLTATGNETREPTMFAARPRMDMLASVADVATHTRDDWRLLDARAPERFRGEVEPLDRVPGHIPGAANHFYQSNLTETGLFRAPADLKASFEETLHGTPPSHVINYCGSGVTACQNLLALEHAGLSGAKLYVGSWSEWSADPARPVEKTAK